jgi:hypothetical protein
MTGRLPLGRIFGGAALALLVAAPWAAAETADQAAATGSAEKLVGAWKMERMEVTDAEGNVSQPMGENPTGYILYTPDGYMAAEVMMGEPEKFAEDNRTGASQAEKATAFDNFLAYGGPYEYKGDHLLHHVEVSSFPNYVGTTQKRNITWTGEDTMILSTDAIGNIVDLEEGEQAPVAKIYWRRAGAASDASGSETRVEGGE